MIIPQNNLESTLSLGQGTRTVESQVKTSLLEKIKVGIENYLIDTSARLAIYTPLMSVMEASCGLDSNQIIRQRAASVVIDFFVGRIYGKTLSFVRKKVKPKSWLGNYFVDTMSMIGVYSPVYVGMLAANGATSQQIKIALVKATLIGMLTARPFAKYVLNRWRKYWKNDENL
jgi:hypothetical protein